MEANTSIGVSFAYLAPVFFPLMRFRILNPGSSMEAESLCRFRAPFDLLFEWDPTGAKDLNHFDLLILVIAQCARLIDRDLIPKRVFSCRSQVARFFFGIWASAPHRIGF